MEKGAATMKRLFLELGGKSATIVLEDADLAQACSIGIAPCMHAGQGCAIPTRMLPRSRYDEGVGSSRRCTRASSRRSPGARHAVRSGDLGQAARRVLGYIQKGIDEGAKLLVGGTEAPAGRDRGSGSSRRCSSTSTTR